MGMFDFLKKRELAEITDLKAKREQDELLIEKLNGQLQQYKPIVDVDAEVEKQKKNLVQMVDSKTTEVEAANEKLTTLNAQYQAALEMYSKLRKEINVFESKIRFD